jgi:hypothetical protein
MVTFAQLAGPSIQVDPGVPMDVEIPLMALVK